MQPSGHMACRAKTRQRIEMIINAFVPRKAFCSSALVQTLEQVSGSENLPLSFGVKQKGLSPVNPHAGFRACRPPFDGLHGGLKTRCDSALMGYYHSIIIHPSLVLLCIRFSAMLYTSCEYPFYRSQGSCVHFSLYMGFTVILVPRYVSPFTSIYISVSQQRPKFVARNFCDRADNLCPHQIKPLLLALDCVAQFNVRIRLVCGNIATTARCFLDSRRCACCSCPCFYSSVFQRRNIIFDSYGTQKPLFSCREPLPPPCRAVYIACGG